MMSENIRKERKRSRISATASGPKKHAKTGESQVISATKENISIATTTRSKNAEARWRSTKNSHFTGLYTDRSDSYAQFCFGRRRERLEKQI